MRSLFLCFCCFFFYRCGNHRDLHSFPTRRSSDLLDVDEPLVRVHREGVRGLLADERRLRDGIRSAEHTSELQSPDHLVCRLLLEKKKSCSFKENIHFLIRRLINYRYHFPSFFFPY